MDSLEESDNEYSFNNEDDELDHDYPLLVSLKDQ